MQTDIQKGTQTCRHTDGQTYRLTGQRHADRHHTYIMVHTVHTSRRRGSRPDWFSQQNRSIQADIHTDIQADIQTDIHTDRKADRQLLVTRLKLNYKQTKKRTNERKTTVQKDR